MKTLSVTVTDDLYDNIKQAVRSRQISKFVSEAVEKKLKEQEDELYKDYLKAAEDEDRETELKEWDTVNVESWN